MADIHERHDLVIIGAGPSGINTAHIVRELLPHRTFTVLEARDVVGGTWNFFKYPGIRSDSPMTLYGFPWHPWPHSRKIGTGPEIGSYITDAAQTDGTYEHIRFDHRVVDAEWRDEDNFWRLTVSTGSQTKTFSANFVFSCTGYYSYHEAFPVDIPGLKTYKGTVVHPQWWPEDLNYSGKRIVVVGSGATTFTLIPALAKKAGHITMLQRSPSYAAAFPSTSWVDDCLRVVLPLSVAHQASWWIDMIAEIFVTQFLMKLPALSRFVLRWMTQSSLPKGCDVDVHFKPRYNPVEQRLCLCPEGDFFDALHRDNVELVTDVIDVVDSAGILLKSGRKLEADIIVTATGLYFQLLSGIWPKVNGERIDPGAHYAWRGTMIDSLPNIGAILGYVVQTYTPGAEALIRVLVRVIKKMEEKQAQKTVPVFPPGMNAPAKLAVDVSSSYFVKAADRIPKVINQGPWYGRTTWLRDMKAVLFDNIETGLEFSGHSKDKKNL